MQKKTPFEKNSQKKKGQVGFTVRTDIRAGDWTCRDCAGEVNGSTMIKPQCGSCTEV